MDTSINNLSIKESWDPLGESSYQDDEMRSVAQKREIRNILKSYTGYYDIFAELIQNALDAVERRIKSGEEDYKPVIWIRIDIREGKISVTDNGCGMDEKEFRNFLKPNISFKDENVNRGNKGVGATYLAYGFNHLEIATRKYGQTYSGVIRKGREWAEDRTDSVVRPYVDIIEPTNDNFNANDQGSSMTIKLEGNAIRPNDLRWVGATTPEQWLAILRVHSPLGGIYLCGEQPAPVQTILEVIDTDGNTCDMKLDTPEFLYPAKVTSSTVDIREFLEDQRQRIEKGLDVTTIPPKFRQLNGIWGEWTADEILDSKSGCPIKLGDNFESHERKFISELGLKLHIFLGFSTSIWDNLNDNELNLRKNYRLLRGGIQLSTRNMPQGSLIRIPMTSYIGLQNQAHILVHFDNAEPDLGRKGFQPDVVRVAEKLSVAAVNALRGHMKLLRKPGTASLFSQEFELDNWKEQQLEHEKKNPLIITGTGLFMPTEELPIRSEPIVEQDVVALFNQMLSSGVIRGIQLISSSQHRQYDALYRIQMSKPFERFMYSCQSNPLGIADEIFDGRETLQSSIKVLEYKLTVDGLVEELQAETKSEQEIDLVVAWDLGNKWKENFDVISYLDRDHKHLRDIHGATHQFISSGNGNLAFRSIILEDLIAYLADPEKEESRQRAKLTPD